MELAEILCTAPAERGQITGYDGHGIAYEIRLLSPGLLNEVRIERNRYLAERSIEECTPATAEIFDAELQIRICAEAVRHPESGEPLAPLETWRKSVGPAVRTCLDHYTRLEALAGDVDMELSGQLSVLESYVLEQRGPGHAAFWQTVDYETLLACFATLVLRTLNRHEDARQTPA